jgi:hypothetical protein
MSASFAMLVLSAWCGLFAGSPEVSTIVFRKQVFDPNHLYNSQASLRSESSLQDEPPLCLADPALERLCFCGTGTAGRQHHPDLATPRSLDVDAHLVRDHAITLRAGRVFPEFMV